MKGKHLKIRAALCLLLVLSLQFQVFGADYKVKYNSRDYLLESQPKIEDTVVMIPVEEVFGILNIQTDWDSSEETITIKNNDDIFKLTAGLTKAEFNEKDMVLTVAPVIENNVLYAPITVISDFLGLDAEYNDEYKILFVWQTKSVVDELYEKSELLSFDEAVEMALANDSSLKNLKENVELMKDNKSTLSQAISSSRSDDLSQAFITDAANLSTLSSIASIDYSLISSTYTEKIIQDSIRASIKNSFNSIKSTELDIQLLEESIKLAESQLDSMYILLDAGMESQANVISTELSLQQTKQKKNNLEIGLNDSYVVLNNLIGANANTTYIIEDNVIYAPLSENFDIEVYITQSLGNNPSLEVKKQAIKEAEFALNAYTYSGTGTTYEQRETELKQANREHADAVTNMEKSLRSNYNSLRQLEESIKTTQLQLAQAQIEYDNKLVEYQVGNATKLELDALEYQIVNYEIAIQQSYYSYDTLKYAFDRPHLLTN